MTVDFSSPASPYLRKLSRIFCVLVFLIAMLVLAGWITKTELLKRLISDAVAVNPLTAILFLLCAWALWLRKEEETIGPHQVRAARISIAVIILATAKFFSFIFNVEIYIDTVLFHYQLFDPARNELNRMAPNTAFCFILAGMSLLWLDRDWLKNKRPAQYFSILITFIALLSLYGYVYGVRFLYGFAHYIPMSVITALNFLLLSLAILFARPEKGTMAVIIGDTSAEVTLLRLTAFIIPLVMGWLKLKGEQLGYFSTEFGTALFAITTYALAMFLLARRSVVNFRMREVKSQANEEVRKAHERFLKFFQLSPEVRTISELPSGRLMYVNKAYEGFFGINAVDAVGKTAIELNTINHEQRVALREELRKSETVRGIESQLKNSQGELRDVYIDTTVIDLGAQKCLLTNVIDITDKKAAEAALKHKEELLRSIVDNIGEGLVVMNRDGEYLVMNQMAKNILRQWPAHVAVNDLTKEFGLFYPDMLTPLPTEETSIARSFRGLETNEFEFYIRNPNIPEGKFLVSTGRPIRDSEGVIVAAVTVFRDDTRRRELESMLIISEQKLQEVIRTVGEGIVMCNPQGKFILYNKKAEEILGQSAMDVPPENWPQQYHLYHPDGKNLFNADELPLIRALKGERIEDVEILLKDSSKGIEKNVLVSAHPVKGEGDDIIAAVANFRDITEMKKLEILLNDIRKEYTKLVAKLNSSQSD